MNIDAIIISLFGAVRIENDIPERESEASVLDLIALASEAGYAFDASVMRRIAKLTPGQRGMLFHRLGCGFEDAVSGFAKHTSPLYRAFPNHKEIPIDQRLAYFFLHLVGIEVQHDPALYGAHPVTGFQDSLFGASEKMDDEFSVPLEVSERTFRFLRLADDAFMNDKLCAMMENLTPFSEDEQSFVKFAVAQDGFDAASLSGVKFREKLPMIYDMVDRETYAKACNSVTDVMRLAAHLSGPRVVHGTTRWAASYQVDADLSLKSAPKFNLKKSQAKGLLAILEAILERGTTDYQTDLMRHEEPWKRFASHVRVRGFEKRFPQAVAALNDLRSGKLRSWEAKYASADLTQKIALAENRPGVFMRRMTALGRLVEASGDDAARNMLAEAATRSFASVDPLKLVQLLVHLERTNFTKKRYHALPSGGVMTSEAAPIDMGYIAKLLREHLGERLSGVVSGSNNDELANIFIPTSNRGASSSNVRTSKGDRVKLSFKDEDVVRFFLHWHHRCDVDISASFYDANLKRVSECTYYNLRSADYAAHSGDILDGSQGAAEYIDISVGPARKAGIRYVLMTANVFSGLTFDTFDCSVGAMLRDGQTGRHFEVSTVETKLNLNSQTRRTNPAIFDLETGEMIYVDLHGKWGQGENVSSGAADLADVMDYFVNFHKYRATFADIIQFTENASDMALTADAVKERQDEILRDLAAA
ncbi:TerD family protein [Sulfitobacter sp. R18_1]|uniref:TerD family protein n=1 Tax=Sulfitobacter sp. R18_1 TaxID=2821104 RepID=UPI001ADD427F|nr:TerD family protein [Sulfitobacter sp. R18_1]MBO9428687.1 TerD family protein [Sulfitobacter sp. R18_1]